MQDKPESKSTLLGSLVNAGEAQSAATQINDFIYMSQDVSNAYLVTTSDGDVLVNTGTVAGAERHKRLFAPVRKGAVKYIFITQSHADHYGGVSALRDDKTITVAHTTFPETRDFYRRMGPFFGPRTAKLWSNVLAGGMNAMAPPEPEIDTYVDDGFSVNVGERTFQVLWTPEGETIDSISIWMPNEKVVFTGNLFGPVFMSMPFLVTLRGDRPRRVKSYLQSLNRVRALEPELLITGHGEPMIGKKRIQDDLTKLYDAVKYVSDATEAGMIAGKDVHTLMREIKLPPELAIGEYHGNVKWAVRSIFDELTGWFHYDSTTSLYGVPRSSIDGDIVELAGGADALAARARQHVSKGQPLEAIHLTDIVLHVAPSCRPALEAKRDALKALLEAGGSVNLSETMWLKSEISNAEKALGE
ncbi:MAG: MBL fold metallo-hydrolase [Caulobacterales bacterium]